MRSTFDFGLKPRFGNSCSRTSATVGSKVSVNARSPPASGPEITVDGGPRFGRRRVTPSMPVPRNSFEAGKFLYKTGLPVAIGVAATGDESGEAVKPVAAEGCREPASPHEEAPLPPKAPMPSLSGRAPLHLFWATVATEEDLDSPASTEVTAALLPSSPEMKWASVAAVEIADAEPEPLLVSGLVWPVGGAAWTNEGTRASLLLGARPFTAGGGP
mmetsp:Transcript_13006/g.30965  ORF Transcript_13006/g.30965 Transcript_13006/m.30965 type:complete len:216 (-) Transcript_13006:593-1240(-)